MPGHSGRAWTRWNTANDGTSLVYVLVSWDNDDATDYLAAGWWLHFPGQHPPYLHLSRAEGGVLIDGPELDLSNPPQMPVEGQATYSGSSGGLYVYERGSDWGDVEGTSAVEEYEGTITITADFSDNTLRGCIGCEGDITTRRSHLRAVLGDEVRDLEAAPTGYELHFGATPFNPDGTFEHSDVTVRHPERPVMGSSGFWGGQFSNVPDRTGNPRLVAGFNEVEFEEDDGSGGLFRGIFTALSEPFRLSGESQGP